MSGSKPSIRPGAAHDLFRKHKRRPLPSEMLALKHGEAVWVALLVQDARRSLDVLERLATRDRDAGRDPSTLLLDRCRVARAALAAAEAALAVARNTVKDYGPK